MSGLGHDDDRMAVQGMPPSSLSTFRSAETAGGSSSLQGETRLLSAHQMFGEMLDPSKASRARNGVVGTQRAVHCKEGTPYSAADQLFDAIPSAWGGADLNIRQVLLVTVHHMLHPITISVLHQVFGAYGVILKLSVVGKLGCCQVLVQYHTCESAAQAMKTLQGRYIYDGCCQLDIKAVKHSELSVLENSSSMQSTLPSLTTTPKKQVPTFDGTNMNRWHADCEKFFELYKIPQVLWILAAEMNMIGDAALWLQAHKTKHVIESWEDLCAVMFHAFGPGIDQKLLDGAEERHDIDDNKILNAKSATSQDSVYSQIQISHKEGAAAGVVCKLSSEEPLKHVAWDNEIHDDVVTHVGDQSLFIEHDMATFHEFQGSGYVDSPVDYGVGLTKLLRYTGCTQDFSNIGSISVCGSTPSILSQIIRERTNEGFTYQSLLEYTHAPPTQLVLTRQDTSFFHIEQLLASRLHISWDPGGSTVAIWH